MSESARVAVMAVGAALLSGGLLLLVAMMLRARAGARLWGAAPGAASEPHRIAAWLGPWLVRAGREAPHDTHRFAIAQGASIVLAMAALWFGTGVASGASRAVAVGIPVLGPGLAVGVFGLPWLAAASIAALPVLLVRAAAVRRAEAIAGDLPLALELLAALSEAGLGFDAALARKLDASDPARPLHTELRRIQRDAASGLRRRDALRRFATRVDAPTVRSVVAALIQAEEVGSGIAEVLRPLADDLRAQRREQALARAETLPDKLAFALVIGFLPGLLFWTLGPSMFQLITMLDAVMRGR